MLQYTTVHGTWQWVLGTLLLCFCCCCCSLVLMALLNIFWGMHKYICPRCLPFFAPPLLRLCDCNEQSWKLLLFSAYGCTRAPKHTRALKKGGRKGRGAGETRRGWREEEETSENVSRRRASLWRISTRRYLSGMLKCFLGRTPGLL